MDAVGRGDRSTSSIVRAYGEAGAPATRSAPTPDQVSAAKLRNTEVYVERATRGPALRRAVQPQATAQDRPALQLFDCITCDKCIPVCPNDANFTFVAGADGDSDRQAAARRSCVAATTDGTLAIREKHQIGNFADFCNDCGNCDVFCPEDGGPYVLKPRVFLQPRALGRAPAARRVLARAAGRAGHRVGPLRRCGVRHGGGRRARGVLGTGIPGDVRRVRPCPAPSRVRPRPTWTSRTSI